MEDLITLLEATRADFNKFYSDGNSAAGTRVRKAMQEVKTSAQALRLHVQETKNT
ncbi:MAG TPA: histone H1 [Phycisphaerales bacterium]|nr:histone H1 [Phycisphaerales bacterium]